MVSSAQRPDTSSSTHACTRACTTLLHLHPSQLLHQPQRLLRLLHQLLHRHQSQLLLQHQSQLLLLHQHAWWSGPVTKSSRCQKFAD